MSARCTVVRGAMISPYYDGASHAAVGVAVSRRCDLFVAAAQGRGDANAMQHAALAFLETQEMKAWVTAALDGK